MMVNQDLLHVRIPDIESCQYIFISFLLQTFYWFYNTLLQNTAAAAAKSPQSCPTLCNPIDGSPPGSSVPGILQARTLEWVAISFSHAWEWKVKVKSLSRARLLATPCTAAHQAPTAVLCYFRILKLISCRAMFLSLGTTEIWGLMIHCCGCCPVHWLGTNRCQEYPNPRDDNQQCFQTLPNFPTTWSRAGEVGVGNGCNLEPVF